MDTGHKIKKDYVFHFFYHYITLSLITTSLFNDILHFVVRNVFAYEELLQNHLIENN